MMTKEMEDINIIEVDKNLRIKEFDESQWGAALPWYQNSKVLYFSEGIEDESKTYDMNMINRMYKYLSSIGELYVIEILENEEWKPIGDAALSEKNMPIVIGDEKYWGKSIGSKVITKLIDRAKEIKLNRIEVEIYHYNERSQNLFRSMGFAKIDEDEKGAKYELILV